MKWLDRILGPDETFSLEDRSLNAILFSTTIFCILAFFGDIFLLSETVFPFFSSTVVCLFLVLYIFGRKQPNYKNLVIPYLIIFLAATVVVWYITGGILGHTLLYYVTLVMLVPIFVHGKNRILVFSGIFLLLLSLFFIEFNHPEFIQNIYENKRIQTIDTFITATFLSLVTGLVMMLIVYSYDKQKRKAEALAKSKDKFFSIIAHDLKGPMASMIQLGQMLMDQDEEMEPEYRKEFIKHIYNCSNETHYLLENLLLWARSESHDLSINPKTLNLLSCIDNSSKVLIESLRQKEIDLSIKVHEAHTVFADQNMLMTIVRNLLSNAIKYTDRGGKISITSSNDEQNQVQLRISDTGIGISENMKSSLFDNEINQSTKGTNNELGTGLGLSICKDFITKNKGQIALESQLDIGTSVIISLPSLPN